jgi:hypothetical protein
MIIIMVDIVVVATDNENELRYTGPAMVYGINCGVTSKVNVVIPRPESLSAQLYHCKPPLTYRHNIKDHWDNCHLPTPVAYGPAPPNL